MFDRNADKQSAVLGTRYGTWWSWYGQFDVQWLQPLQFWLSAGISSVAPALVSWDGDICHVQLRPTWFKPSAECSSWQVASNLHNGYQPVGLCLDQESLLLVGPLFHFPKCRSGKYKGYRCVYPQLPANRTLSQSRLLHCDELDPCVGNSTVPEWWL